MRIHGFGMRQVVGASAAAALLCAPAWCASGDVVWEQQIASGHSVLAPSPGRAQTSVLRAYDAQTGRLLWQTPGADRQLVSMTTYRSRVYAVGMKGSSAIVSAYEIGSGARLWKRRVVRASSDSITAASGVVAIYGRDLRGSSVLQVLDRESGEPIWAGEHEDTWGFQVLVPVAAFL